MASIDCTKPNVRFKLVPRRSGVTYEARYIKTLRGVRAAVTRMFADNVLAPSTVEVYATDEKTDQDRRHRADAIAWHYLETVPRADFALRVCGELEGDYVVLEETQLGGYKIMADCDSLDEALGAVKDCTSTAKIYRRDEGGKWSLSSTTEKTT